MKPTIVEKTLKIGDKDIKYTLTRKSVKNINLRIKFTGEVLVSASNRVSLKHVENFIKSKGEYILFHLEKFEMLKKQEKIPSTNLKNAVKNFVDGEFFYYLGKILELKVIQNKVKKVKIEDGFLILQVPNTTDFNGKKKLMDNFYDENCKNLLTQMVKEIYPIFEALNIAFPTIKFRAMKSRWGSCIPQKNQITLNKKLLEVPVECSQYVVLHEFSHFIHPNHSRDFYDFVEKLMPDYKARKKILEEYSHICR